MFKTTLCFIFQCISGQCLGSAYNAVANNLAWEAATGAAPCGSPAAWNAAGAPLAASWAAAPMGAYPYANGEWCAAAGYSPAALAASNGGGLAITSASPIAPTGVAMTSENAYEGPLAVAGSLPFLGAVALEGALPTAGAGAVTYGCGNGNVGILNEELAPPSYNALAGAYGYGPATAAAELSYGYGAPFAYEAGIAGPAYGAYGYRGCGCGALQENHSSFNTQN